MFGGRSSESVRQCPSGQTEVSETETLDRRVRIFDEDDPGHLGLNLPVERRNLLVEHCAAALGEKHDGDAMRWMDHLTPQTSVKKFSVKAGRPLPGLCVV
jgi:hypothetical protein